MTREAVLDCIRDNPGCCHQDVADLLGAHRTTVDHHVHALEREGLVHLVPFGRGVYLFVRGSGLTEQDKRILIFGRRAVFGEDRLALLSELADAGRPLRPMDLHRRTGVPVGRIRCAIEVAHRLGLVRVHDGGYVGLPDMPPPDEVPDEPMPPLDPSQATFATCAGCQGPIIARPSETPSCPTCGRGRARVST